MLLGLDIGTSSVKAIVVRNGALLNSANVPISTSRPKPGWSEQDPEDWWRASVEAISSLARTVPLADVRAIGLSGQMHGAVLLDHRKRSLRPTILWNDSRAAEACAQLRRAIPDIGEKAGVLPLPGFTAPKLSWMKTHEPTIYGRIAHVLLPKDYVGLRLHGELATDRSDAAGTLWLDQRARAWSPELAAASDTAMDWLPALHDGHEIVGAVTAAAAAETGLRQGTVVCAGAGDAAAGAVALGATEPGRGFISLGTSGQLFVADTHYRPDPARYVHAFTHTVPGRWYQMAAMLNGARPLAWLAEQLKLDAAEIAALAESADPSRVPIFLPYLTGERSPHGDPHIRAAFYGLDDATDRGALARAVIEAIAFTFADALDSLGGSVSELPALLAIGGGSRSDYLLQTVASVTGIPVGRVSGSDAGPALGAARLAACGIGEIAASEVSHQPEAQTLFQPAPSAAFADRLQRFRTLYGALRDLAQAGSI